MPVRGERSSFKLSIDSLNKTCTDHKKAEILVKVDADSDISYYSNILRTSKIPSKILIYDRLGGYGDIYLFLNDLCKIASGEHFWQFNDDNVVYSGDWLGAINKCKNIWADNIYVCYFSYAKNSVNLNARRFQTKCCSIMSRKFYECMGHCMCHYAYCCDRLINLVCGRIKRRTVMSDVILLNTGTNRIGGKVIGTKENMRIPTVSIEQIISNFNLHMEKS